jgi:hypothetical protein
MNILLLPKSLDGVDVKMGIETLLSGIWKRAQHCGDSGQSCLYNAVFIETLFKCLEDRLDG